MAATITALNVRLGMDASQFSQGADLTRQEVNKIASTMRRSVPDSEKFKREVDLLNRAFSSAGKQSREYQNAIEHLRKKYKQVPPTIKNATNSVKKFNASMLTGVPIVGKFSSALTGPLGALLSLTAALVVFRREMKESAERIDVTAKAAKSMNASYTDLLAIQKLVAETTGVGSEETNRSMQMFARNIANAAAHGGRLADTLQSVGLNAVELAGMSTGDAFAAVAQAVSETSDKAEQLRVVTDLVGRSGVRMIEAFRAGAGAVQAQRANVEALGLALSDEAVAGVEAMNDAWGVTALAVDGAWDSITAQLAPAMTEMAKLTQEMSIGFSEMLRSSAAMSDSMQEGSSHLEVMVRGWRIMFAVVKDLVTLNWGMGSLKEIQREIAFNRMGLLTGSQQAAKAAQDAQQASERALATSQQHNDTYEKMVENLHIQRLEIIGMSDASRRLQLTQQGLSEVQVDSIMAQEKEIEAIKRKQKAEEEASKARKDAHKEWQDGMREKIKAAEEAESAFVQEIETARQAAEQYFAEQKAMDDKRRDDVSKGPGAGIEANSSQAAKFMADQVNRQIGAAAVPEQPTPGEDQIVRKAGELLVAQREANTRQDEQLTVMREQLAELKENRFTRIR